MKGISETVSTMIIFSIIIIVVILIFMISFTLLNITTQTSEYGYVKTIFINLANSLPEILEGGSYGAQIPSRTIGIGYMKEENPILIKIAGELVYSNNPVIVYAKTFNPMTTVNKTLFGKNSLIVDETILLSRVNEIYINGSNYITLDTARVFLKKYLYTTETESRFIVNVIYVRIEPVLLSNQPNRLTVSHAGVNQIIRLIDLNEFSGDEVLEISSSSGEKYILRKNDFNQANSVFINIRIVSIRVVYM
uniref:Uncharacterized protein n=1 Tax=Staphylothermus marinus TaxID=2280 RepID=A0A7C4HFB7_STAMA